MASSYILPAAIVVGSGLIALGLYFGLAARPVAPTAQPEPGALTSAKAEPGALTSAKAEPSTVPKPIDPSVTEAAAQQALDALKPTLIEACWKPALAANPEPAEARWTYDVTFDTKGVAIARGISDVRGMERGDVASCLRTQPMRLRVPPPPVNTRVTLQLSLP